MYYAINHSMDVKIVGKFFQSESILNYIGENPIFLNNIFFEKIDFVPIVPIPILHKKAKITDLISNVNAGGNLHLIMSHKLKAILNNYRSHGLQFFKTSIIKENVKYDDYYSLNLYELNDNYIDFENSIIFYDKHCDDFYTSYQTEKVLLKVKDLSQFMEHIEISKIKAESIYIEKLSLKKDIKEDFFALKYVFGSIYFVSEKLKVEIENSGCTGIEFQPTELSYNEWTSVGGEREKVYGKI